MSLYKRDGSDLWWVNISIPNHPRVRRSTGTPDRIEAQRIHDEIKAGLWSAPEIKGRRWSEAVMLWASADGRGEPDILSMAKFAKIYKDRAITDVTREGLVAALSFCNTSGTYMRYRGRIMAILNIAHDEGWLRDVPKLPTRTSGRAKPRVWLTAEQWATLKAELPPHMVPMASFAIETGLRQSNVLGLAWEKVDIERRLVWVEAEDAKGKKALPIPLSVGAVEVLRSKVGEHPVYVFTYHGRAIQEIKTAFIAACIRAGLGKYVDKPGGGVAYRGFTWHGFRHTWATWHIQNGTPLEVLQKLGGWSTLR